MIGTSDDEELPSTLVSGSGGFAGGSASGSAAAGSSVAPQPPAGGGGYTNLSQYLNANQGSGSTTGQAASNTVVQDVNNANNANNTYFNDAKAQNDAAWAPASVNQNVLNSLTSGQVRTAPTVTYTAPTYNSNTLNDQANAQKANATAVGDAANAGAGQTGVSALLNKTYTNPSYTQGENTLDSFLVGGTSDLSNVSGLGSGITNSYNGIQASLAGQQNAGYNNAANTNAVYQNAVNNYAPPPAPTPVQSQTSSPTSNGQNTKTGSGQNGGELQKITNKLMSGMTPTDPVNVIGSIPNANTVIDKVSAGTNNAANKIANVAQKKLGFAHGGEVPRSSYVGILNKLRGSK